MLESLHQVLERLDQSRLHGRLRHERIPRVIVLQTDEDGNRKLEPELAARISYYRVEARPHTKRSSRS